MKASARANKPWGYKAVIVHAGPPRSYTEILARQYKVAQDGESIQTKAGHNFETRAAAIAYAEDIIAQRLVVRAEKMAEWLKRHPEDVK